MICKLKRSDQQWTSQSDKLRVVYLEEYCVSPERAPDARCRGFEQISGRH